MRPRYLAAAAITPSGGQPGEIHEMGALVDALGLAGHLNKNGGAAAVYRSVGSIAHMASVRVALLVGTHPRESTRRIVTVSKSNLGMKPEAWVYEVVDDGSGEPVVAWGEPCDVSADQLLLPTEPQRRGIGWSSVGRAKIDVGVRHYYVD